MRVGINSISVDVAAGVELNAATAQYQLLQPGEVASDWLPVSAATNVTSSTLRLRVDGVTPRPALNNALTTVQFRVSPSGASAYACSGAYSLFTATTFIYMPTVARSVISSVVDLTTLTEPDNNVCLAGYTLQTGQSYVARLSDTNDFYKIVVTQKSSLYFTVTNFTQAGQVQFRSTVGTDCNTQTATNGALFNATSFQSIVGASRSLVVPNVDPGTYYLRIVLTSGGAPPNADYLMEYSGSTAPASPYEPNNTPCSAKDIVPGTDYTALPDDSDDWYVFDLQIRSNIQLVASHAVTTMQYLIYAGAACGDITSNTQLVAYDGGKTSVTLNVAGATVRKYFVRVAPTNNYRSATASYTFKVTTTSALAAQAEHADNIGTLPEDQTPLPLVVEPEEAPIP